MKKLSIVVPVYFNEGSLPLLGDEVEILEQQLLAKGVELELIFVDDGSKDGSYREILKIKARRPATTVVKLARNFGSIHAFKTGLQYVTGDCFLCLAADLQDPPALILEMIDRWLGGCKYVICIREKRQDPLATRLFAGLHYRLLRLVGVKDYPVGGYDLGLMDRRMLAHLRDSNKNVNVNVFAFWLGFTPTTMSYVRRERLHGKSGWTFSKKVKYFLDTLLGFSIVPLRAISAVGIAVSGLSILYGAFVFVTAAVRGTEVPGFTTVVSLITFLLGTIICMLGVIGEYLWRIFDEINKRPGAVVEELHLPTEQFSLSDGIIEQIHLPVAPLARRDAA